MNQRYSVNETFFSTQTPLSCYWAGFIAADGYINNRETNGLRAQKQLGIGLKAADSEHLAKFKSDIEYSGPLYYRTYGTGLNGNPLYGVEIKITSNRICDDLLSNFNIGPRKSLTAEPPIIENFINKLCFIAGLIDGDGCIIANDKVFAIDILGTKSVLDWVYIVFTQILLLDTLPSAVRPKGKIFSLRVGSLAAIKLYKVLLNLSSLGLPLLIRKWIYPEETLLKIETRLVNYSTKHSRNENSPSGQAWCSYNKHYEDISLFGICKSEKNGLAQYCKPCYKIYRKHLTARVI